MKPSSLCRFAESWPSSFLFSIQSLPDKYRFHQVTAKRCCGWLVATVQVVHCWNISSVLTTACVQVRERRECLAVEYLRNLDSWWWDQRLFLSMGRGLTAAGGGHLVLHRHSLAWSLVLKREANGQVFILTLTGLERQTEPSQRFEWSGGRNKKTLTKPKRSTEGLVWKVLVSRDGDRVRVILGVFKRIQPS